jgi:hypothetical protein
LTVALRAVCQETECTIQRTNITGETQVSGMLVPETPLYYLSLLATRYYSISLSIAVQNATAFTFKAVPQSYSGIAAAEQSITSQAVLTTSRMLLLRPQADTWEFTIECPQCPQAGIPIVITIEAEGIWNCNALEFEKADVDVHM